MKKCLISKQCGGCQYSDVDYQQQLINKEQQVAKLFPKNKIEPIISMKHPYYYRHKVITGFSLENNRVVSGLFSNNSHKIIKKSSCLIEDESLQAINNTITKICNQQHIAPYNEDKQTGYLRYTVLRKSYFTKEVMVILVVSSLYFPGKKNFLKALLAEHEEISTVVLNENHRRTSIVLTPKQQVIYGPGYIEDSLLKLHFQLSPLAFYQVNPEQTEKLYELAIKCASLKKEDVLMDCYCGTGTIGIIASKQVSQVYAVELNQSAVKDAIKNARNNHCKNITFICQDAGEYLQQSNIKTDVIVIDPPREGASKQFLSALIKANPKKVIYISCNPLTQKRDCDYLLNNKYRIEYIQPVDLFPMTNHVENIVLMSRKDK